MNTQSIISEIENEFDFNEIQLNHFAEAIESAQNHAIDSAVQVFHLRDVAFYEDGVYGLDDQDLIKKVDKYFFETFQSLLQTKAEGISTDLALIS